MVDKVITSLQKSDAMEQINTITDINVFATDNWVNLSTFEDNPELKDFVSDYEYDALQNGDADYIAFRIDY